MNSNSNNMPALMKDMVRLDETEGLLKSSFRTLALFEYFADVQRPLNIGEICKGLDIPQSSGSALTKSLVDSGFLNRNLEDRTYYPTLRLSFLSRWNIEEHPNQKRLLEATLKLQSDVGETVIMAQRNGIYSQYIYVVHSKKGGSSHVKTGSLRPLVCSATGWSLLIKDTDAEIGKLIRRTQVETDNLYWQDTARNALEHIQKARENDFAYASGPAAQGTAGIAVYIPNANETPLAVGVAGSAENIENKKDAIIDHILRLKSELTN